MDSQITPNTFCTFTSSSSHETTTVFFVSGNPGLIGYYHPFLSLLGEYLGKSKQDPNTGESFKEISEPSFQIYGCSLGGFEVDDDHASPSRTNKVLPPQSTPKLYDLEDQIVFVHDKLHTLMSQNTAATATEVSNPPTRRKVVLIGHSVGAYIAMEILRRHREARPDPNSRLEEGSTVDFDIVGGVMLFPTVKDIAHSPSGQKLTTLLSLIPQLAVVVNFCARILTTLLPSMALRSLINLIMHDPPNHALETTTFFLKSPGAVRQALHMAADEMRTITSDKWTDDVWGVAHTREPLTKLFFYFGRNDHWVAEKTRDEIIALRGTRDGGDPGAVGPKMFVCEDGLPHAFCLKHSDTMAKKVASMVWDIVRV